MEGIVFVEDIDSSGIVGEGIAVVDIVQDDTKVALVHLASSHHFSLSRYPLSFLAVVEVLCSLFHHGLLIYKIYNTN